jgi:hypothetical protein
LAAELADLRPVPEELVAPGLAVLDSVQESIPAVQVVVLVLEERQFLAYLGQKQEEESILAVDLPDRLLVFDLGLDLGPLKNCHLLRAQLETVRLSNLNISKSILSSRKNWLAPLPEAVLVFSLRCKI